MQPGNAERLRTAIVRLVVAALILLALALTGLRVAVSYAPTLRAKAEAVLSEGLGETVSMATLDARLHGTGAVLDLRDVRLGDGDRSVELERLRVRVDLLTSLRTASLYVAEVGLAGIALTLERGEDGDWALAGLPDVLGLESAPVRSPPEVISLSEGHLRIRDRVTGREHELRDVTLRLERSGTGHRLMAGFRAPGLGGDAVRLAVESDSTLDSLDSWSAFSGRIHADLPRARLDRLLALLPGSGELPPADGRADTRVWADIVAGRPTEVVAEVAARDLTLGDDRPLRLATVQGRGRWRSIEGGWALDVNGLRLQRDGERMPPVTDLSVRMADDRWRAGAGRVPLQDAAELAAILDLLPARVAGPLAGLAPRGLLRQLRLAAGPGPDSGWRVTGQLEDAAVSAYGSLPSVSGVSGRFVATDRGGTAQIAASDGVLHLPRVFRGPMPFAHLGGRVRWWRHEEGTVQVDLKRFRAEGEDGRLDGRAAVWLPPGRAPFLDVRAHVAEASGARISRYLPVSIMPDPLVSWLDRAVRGGRSEGAELVLFGPADAFPFRGGEGMFDVQASVEDVDLAYHREWPPLEGLAGRLRFRNGGMRIGIDRGRLHGAALETATARIPNLKQAVLDIEGTARGSGEDMLRFLMESPLVRKGREALRDVSLTGEHRLQLGLRLPLGREVRREREPEVDGALHLSGGRLRADRWGAVLDEVEGVVHFDRNGLWWRGLRSRFADRVLVSNAHTSGYGADARIQVDALFRAGIADLLADRRPSGGAPFAGRTDWHLGVDLPGFRADGGAPARVELTSDLRGVTVDLPEPLGKPPEQARRLVLETRLGLGGTEPLHLRYGDDVAAVVEPGSDSSGIRRAGIGLGGVEPSLPETPGVVAAGRVEDLDLDAWLAFLREADRSAPPEGGERAAVRSLDLRIGEVAVRGFGVRDVEAVWRRQEDGWTMQLNGPAAAGTIRSAGTGGPPRLQADLQRLHLTRSDTGTPSAPGEGSGGPPPPLDVAVTDLRVGERRYGDLTIRTSAEAGGGRALESLRLDGEHLRLQAEGGWRPGPAGGHSRMRFTLESGDAGRSLALFGYARSIQGGNGSAEGTLTWRGPLYRPALDSLSGELRFGIQDGTLPAVEPGAGRIFGLLSLAQLPRRLILDFSDLFGEGLAFQRIEADMQLENGIARPEVFVVDSSAALIEVSGEIDLAERRYAQTVTVVPRLSSTLPLIGGLAGGPTAAVVLLVTQKLFQQGVDRLTQYRYRVTGPWDDPRIERMDGGGSGGGNG